MVSLQQLLFVETEDSIRNQEWCSCSRPHAKDRSIPCLSHQALDVQSSWFCFPLVKHVYIPRLGPDCALRTQEASASVHGSEHCRGHRALGSSQDNSGY